MRFRGATGKTRVDSTAYCEEIANAAEVNEEKIGGVFKTGRLLSI